MQSSIDPNYVQRHIQAVSDPAKRITRVDFDPADPSHRQAAVMFLGSGKWGTLQFNLEPDFSNIPEMVAIKSLFYYASLDPALK